MKKVTIGHKDYHLICGFKDNSQIRASFNLLSKDTFNFSFEDFYKNGYWNERYLPYALMDNGKLIANASVNILDFMMLGTQKRFIQIGTVMTDCAYRNLGLSRFLLETIIDEWCDKSELIYLFANDTVLDFYTKFGFDKKSEYCYFRDIEPNNDIASLIHMDMSLAKERELLSHMSQQAHTFGQLCPQCNHSLVMFYATSFMQDDFYYIANLDAIICAKYNGNILYLNDIFCTEALSLDDVISAMTAKDTTRVVLGFSPIDTAQYQIQPYSGDDTLFVMGNAADLFDDHQLMFPLLSHA